MKTNVYGQTALESVKNKHASGSSPNQDEEFIQEIVKNRKDRTKS